MVKIIIKVTMIMTIVIYRKFYDLWEGAIKWAEPNNPKTVALRPEAKIFDKKSITIDWKDKLFEMAPFYQRERLQNEKDYKIVARTYKQLTYFLVNSYFAGNRNSGGNILYT